MSALHGVGEAVDRVHARIGEWLRPGRTEDEIGADIAAALVEEGHERADFVIVASGPHGASPHHERSDRVVRAGEPVVVDIGGPAPSGYFSDSTRTYVCGEPVDPEFDRVWRTVRDAQRAGIDAARAGLPCSGVDAAARRVVEAAGYGAFFITRTGHGIGLEVHEHPYLVRGDDLPLAPGMTFWSSPASTCRGASACASRTSSRSATTAPPSRATAVRGTGDRPATPAARERRPPPLPPTRASSAPAPSRTLRDPRPASTRTPSRLSRGRRARTSRPGRW